MDGTPISPSRGVSTAVDAPVDATGEKEAAATSPTAAAAAGTMTITMRMAFPREGEQSKLHQHQRQDRFDAATKNTGNAPQDRRRTYDSGAGLSASKICDGREVDQESCWQNDVALDGVVFMVYAKRL